MRYRRFRRKDDEKFEKFFFYLFLFLLLVWVSGYFFNRGEHVAATVPKIDNIYYGISIQVLNGCGVKGVSQAFAEMLRAGGFTVDYFGNASSMDYPETILLDRKGNRAKALLITNFLGLDSLDVIIQRASEFVYTDFVLIIGRDYKRYLKKEGV